MNRVWLIQEQATTWLEDFQIKWLPETAQGKIRAFSRRDGAISGLEIGGWVGSVELLNGDTLHVQPKIGPVNFFQMLAISEGLDPRILEQGLAHYSDTANATTLSLIVNPFISSVRRLSALGKAFAWTRHKAIGTANPGRLDLVETSIRVFKHEKQPFVGTRQTRSTDIPANRVLAATASLILAEFSRSVSSDDFRLLRSWSRFGWNEKRLSLDIHNVRNSIASGDFLGSRGYYQEALKMALLVLGNNGFSLDGKAESRGSARLLNSAEVFEKFIRLTVGSSLNRKGLFVYKENPNSRFLFEGGVSGIEPDILISRGMQIKMLGDVKYKSASSSDYYQLLAYLDNYGLREGFIVDTQGTDEGRYTVLSTPTGKRVHSISIPSTDTHEMAKSIEKHIHQICASI